MLYSTLARLAVEAFTTYHSIKAGPIPGYGGEGGGGGSVVAKPGEVGVSKGLFDESKFDYLFGRGGGNVHNLERTAENVTQLRRIGIYDTAESRSLLRSHFEPLISDPSNVSETFFNRWGLFQTRDSLFAGPGGFVRFESTWEAMGADRWRFTTAIPFGTLRIK